MSGRFFRIAYSSCRYNCPTSRQRAAFFNRRKFSSNGNEKKPELTTEEKAAEINKEAWPTVKKYGPLIIPAALCIVSTIVMVNNPAYRAFVERTFPQYDHLVRTKYGYVEDLEERARIIEVERMLSKPVNIIVEFHSGQSEIVRSVDPSQPFSEFVHRMEHMYESEGRIIKNITFADEEVDSYGSDEGGTVPVSATVAPRTEDPLWMPLIKEEVKARRRGYVHATLGLDNMQSCWWGAFTATGSPARGSSNSNKSSSGGVGNSNVPLSKQFLLEKYQNTVGEMLSDYALYRKLENRNKLARKISVLSSSGDASNSAAATHPHGLSSKALKALQRQEAKEAIASLERRIADLNAEKQYSRREIDDIEHDIANLKKEIVQLKRKHLNYFYFF